MSLSASSSVKSLPPIKKVDVEISDKETYTPFQKHVLRELCTEEYFRFVNAVEQNLHLGKYETIRQLFKDNISKYQLPINYRKDFDFMLEKVLSDSKDQLRFAKALQLIKIMTKNYAASQFTQLCEIACQFELGETELAKKNLKLLAQFACLRSYKEVLTQHLDRFKVNQMQNLIDLFKNLPDKLRSIPQQLLPPLKA